MSEVTDDELTCRSLSSRTGACRLVYALSSDGLLRLGARNSTGKHLPRPKRRRVPRRYIGE